MFRWQKPQSGSAEGMDEHNQPTEPVPHFPDPTLPTVPGAGYPIQVHVPPAPQQQEQPFPYVGGMPAPQPFQPQYVPGVPPVVYPPYPLYPPTAAPAPLFGRRRGRKWRGQPAVPVYPGAYQPVWTPPPVERYPRRMLRRSPVPALVGLFFTFVQLILLTRFVLKIVNPSQTTAWMDIVYALSSLFLLPVLALVQQITLPFSIGVELYTLLAILLYGVFSRILVKILRLFM